MAQPFEDAIRTARKQLFRQANTHAGRLVDRCVPFAADDLHSVGSADQTAEM